MKKIILAAILTTVMVIVSSCNIIADNFPNANSQSDSQSNYEPNISKNTEELLLTNSFLKLSVTIPKGWYTIYINQDNINSDPQTTQELDSLAVDESSYGALVIDMLDVSNVEDNLTGNHVEWVLYAEKYEGGMDEALSVLKENMLYVDPDAQSDDDTFKFLEEKQVTINRTDYMYLSFISQREDANEDYLWDFYITMDGEYFIFNEFTYWVTSSLASKQVDKIMNNYISVGASEQTDSTGKKAL